MKKVLLLTVLYFSSLIGLAQEPYKNRIFFSLTAFGDLPLFNFAHRGYPAGFGGNWAVLSPKITLSDSNQLWLRFGGSVSSSRQMTGNITIPDGHAKIRNSYIGLNLLTRLSWEKRRRWRPFVEAAFVWNVFESRYSVEYTGNTTHKYEPPTFYHGYLPGVSLAAGYMYRITDGFLLEAKLAYLQSFKKIDFARPDRAVKTNGNFLPDVSSATPSMLFLHLGIMFRLPNLRGPSVLDKPSTPRPSERPSPQQKPTPPNKDRKYNFTW